jgi:hypothetical protein
MGTNYESPDNLQFNAGDIIFLSFILVGKFKIYGNTSNFTILEKFLRISSPKFNRLTIKPGNCNRLSFLTGQPFLTKTDPKTLFLGVIHRE